MNMKIDLSFKKLEDGSCDVFADIFSPSIDSVQLTVERIKFVQKKMYTQDEDNMTLFNVPFETLREFAESILKEV